MGTSKEKNAPGKKKKSGFKKFMAWVLVAGLLAVVCALGFYIWIIYNGQRMLNASLNDNKFDLAESSHIYDSSDKPQEIYTLARENRQIVTGDQIPKRLKDAFIATEDRRFNEHAGVDFYAIGRAIYKDVVERRAAEGASTITQQLAKNVIVGSDKTIFRKANEAAVAVALENQYTKDQILELYLNRILFGGNAYGVKTASMRYFGKDDLNKLELWEIATLAALPKAPNTYSPLTNPEKSKERRGVVLQLMKDQGYITEADRAAAAAVDYVPPKQAATGVKKDFASYADYVVKEAADMYNIDEDELLRGGYKIYTSIDINAQKILEQAYANPKFFQEDAPDGVKMQSSTVIVNNKDGGIVAMIGGRDYKTKDMNRAVVGQQPGSSFKPIVDYAPALESGKFNPYSKLPDDPSISFGDYKPRNWDGKYRGEVTMFDALKYSINVPAVWTLNEVGITKGMKMAADMGIPLDPAKDRNLAIALGGLTGGASPLQMAQAYSAFPNNGVMYKAHAILRIVDSKGREQVAFKQDKKQVMSAKTAYYSTFMMQGVVEPGGLGSAARFNRPVAGKTGTTQLTIQGLEKYNKDAWFVGYTPEWTAATWMGFDKTDSKHYVRTGSDKTAALFREYMSKSLDGVPITDFKRPPGVPDLNAPDMNTPKGIGDLSAHYARDSRSVKLDWSPIGQNTIYQVFRKDSKSPDFVQITSSATPTATDLSVITGETYQYYVVPVNRDTNETGDRSNVASLTIPQDQLPAPGTDQNQKPGGQTGGGTQPGGQTGGGTQPGGQTGGSTQPGGQTGGGAQPGGQTGGSTQPGGQTGGGTQPGGQTGGGSTQPGGQTGGGSTQPGGQPGGPTQPGGQPGGPTQPGGQTGGATQPGGQTGGATQPGGQTGGATQPGGQPGGSTQQPKPVQQGGGNPLPVPGQ